jgi:hypothetical protein
MANKKRRRAKRPGDYSGINKDRSKAETSRRVAERSSNHLWYKAIEKKPWFTRMFGGYVATVVNKHEELTVEDTKHSAGVTFEEPIRKGRITIKEDVHPCCPQCHDPSCYGYIALSACV